MNSFGFGVSSIMLRIIPVIIVGIIVISLINELRKSIHNNSQPVLKVEAKIVSKRTKARGQNTRTYYYVTFEFESGDRKEIKMKGNEFGMLVEGDKGNLTFQGDKYLGFVRA